MRIACRACGAEVGVLERIGRRDGCPSCGVDLHSCRQCRFYDVAAYNACREPQAERVVDKERANFCDWFATAEPAAARGLASGLGARAASNPTPAAGPAAAGDPRAALDRLFRRH
jgi:hypothetical protein